MVKIRFVTTYGVDFALSYKGFSLSGLFYGTGKRHMEFGVNTKKDESLYIKNEYQLDYWREDNPDAMFPRRSLSANINGKNNQEKSSFWFKRSFRFSLFEISDKNPALHRAKQGLNRSKSGQTALKYKQQNGKHNENKADGDSTVQYDLREMG